MKRTFLFVSVFLVLAIVIAVVYPLAYSAGEKSVPIEQRIVEIKKEARTTELSYEPEELKTLGAKEWIVDFVKLEPKDYITDITYEKWTGDDVVIAIPNSNPTAEPGLSKRYNRITILGKDGIIAQYDTGKHDVTDIHLLSDRMLLKTRVKESGKPTIAGVLEVDYNGKGLWGLSIDGQSHSVEPLPNGNYLIMRGDLDQAVEMTRDGQIAWEWNAYENIQQFSKENFVAYADRTEPAYNIFNEFRMETPAATIWTHMNAVQKLDDGYLISMRNLNLVVKVGFDKKIQWTFGALQIKYQHRPRQLENGNLLIYDNGGGRVVEFTRMGEVVFEYPIYSAVWGTVDKLSNGNYIFPSCFEGIIYEVTPQKEVVKKIQMGKMPVIRAYLAEDVSWIK